MLRLAPEKHSGPSPRETREAQNRKRRRQTREKRHKSSDGHGVLSTHGGHRGFEALTLRSAVTCLVFQPSIVKKGVSTEGKEKDGKQIKQPEHRGDYGLSSGRKDKRKRVVFLAGRSQEQMVLFPCHSEADRRDRKRSRAPPREGAVFRCRKKDRKKKTSPESPGREGEALLSGHQNQKKNVHWSDSNYCTTGLLIKDTPLRHFPQQKLPASCELVTPSRHSFRVVVSWTASSLGGRQIAENSDTS